MRSPPNSCRRSSSTMRIPRHLHPPSSIALQGTSALPVYPPRAAHDDCRGGVTAVWRAIMEVRRNRIALGLGTCTDPS